AQWSGARRRPCPNPAGSLTHLIVNESGTPAPFSSAITATIRQQVFGKPQPFAEAVDCPRRWPDHVRNENETRERCAATSRISLRQSLLAPKRRLRRRRICTCRPAVPGIDVRDHPNGAGVLRAAGA